MIYYPIEKFASRLTDVLITINKEDYKLAQKKMKAKKIEYVPGIGIDVPKFSPDILSIDKKKSIRRTLGVSDDEKMLLSVGELINRKNYESVIRALADLKNEKWKYFICGDGELHETLQQLISR
jgi:glycosyltransferase involved in cell wall biosynthesis